MLAIPIILYLTGSLLLNLPREEPQASIAFDSDPDITVPLPWVQFSGVAQEAAVTGSILLPPASKTADDPQALYFSGYEGILRIFSDGDLLVYAGTGSTVQGPSHLQDLLVRLPANSGTLDLTFSIKPAGTQFVRLRGGYLGPVSNFDEVISRHNFYYNDLRKTFIGVEIFIALILGALVVSKSSPTYYRHLVSIVLFFMAIQASSLDGDPFSLNAFYHQFVLLLPYVVCLGYRLVLESNDVHQPRIKTACRTLLAFAFVLAIPIQLDLLPGAQATLIYSLPVALIIWAVGVVALVTKRSLWFRSYLTFALLITTISALFGIAHDLSVKFGWIDSNLLFVPLCTPIFFASVAFALIQDLAKTRRELEDLNRELQQKVINATAEIQRESSKRVIVEVEQAKTQTHKNLTMDLHDGVLGYLSSMYALLEPRTDSKTTTVKKLAKSAMDEIRLMLNRSSAGQQGSLLVVLSVFQDQMQSRLNSMDVDLQMDVTALADYDSPSDQFNLDVYRILQEATTNAVDRAACTELRIVAYTEGHTHFLCIENGGGQGLSLASDNEPLHGTGLSNMRGRAEAHGAEMSIAATATGARLVIRLPPARNA
jgi:signal transduction histidine kinase